MDALITRVRYRVKRWSVRSRAVVSFALAVTAGLTLAGVPTTTAAAAAQPGQVSAWGANAFSAAGGKAGSVINPRPIPGLTDATAVTGDGQNGFALRSDGRVWTWGRRVGPFPQPVAGTDSVVAIAAGSSAAYALRADGTVWAWGWNDRGQLGNGTTIPSVHFAVPVARLSHVISIAAGGKSAYALLPSGRVYAWGSNQWGQLGDGTTEDRSTPVMVQHLAHVRSIAAGGRTAYAVRSDEYASAWGDNSSGQLGIGTRGGTQSTPVTVKHLGGVVTIAAGPRSAYAIVQLVDRWVRAWGSNADGRLGLHTAVGYQLFPHKVPGPYRATALAAGTRSAYVLELGGSVYSWGAGALGQLGDGIAGTWPPGYSARIVHVHTNTGAVVAIGAGGDTAYAAADPG